MTDQVLYDLADKCNSNCEYNYPLWKPKHFRIKDDNIEILKYKCKEYILCTSCRLTILEANIGLRDIKIKEISKRLEDMITKFEFLEKVVLQIHTTD